MDEGNLIKKTREFLSYNKDNIFKNLLQAEHHAKMLDGEVKGGHANCIVKHLAFIEGEAEEAINHAQLVEPHKVEYFKALRDLVYLLRKQVMSGLTTSDELNRKIWVLRKMFESFNEEYDTTKCTACEALSYYDISREMEKLQEIS
jgi:hypothetical protein